MDHNPMLKFQAIKKSKMQQFLDKVLLYTFIAFTCSFLPCLFSSFKNFLFVSSTKMGSIVYNPKLLFLLGNLIVAVLIGESKFFAHFSGSGDVYYDEYADHRSPSPGNDSILEVKREMKMKHCEENVTVTRSFQVEDRTREVLKKEKKELQGEHEVVLPTEELKKRADDFIARVNRQRRLEATLSVQVKVVSNRSSEYIRIRHTLVSNIFDNPKQ
ncbi:Hydroxysteroid dehydrogenase 1 [Hibiscus syriacus]|uniref:Hydroxysteroid dehydrogenase 1 n=1 Tax=Hibiscus syriacus TaxID=106335 RepID=A0A6A3BZ11_HIBSY|nr:Hydroxysteroid dehydrogenase 1 [Hibiscus syriacus]